MRAPAFCIILTLDWKFIILLISKNEDTFSVHIFTIFFTYFSYILTINNRINKPKQKRARLLRLSQVCILKCIPQLVFVIYLIL